jgi:hypothetical protein
MFRHHRITQKKNRTIKQSSQIVYQHIHTSLWNINSNFGQIVTWLVTFIALNPDSWQHSLDFKIWGFSMLLAYNGKVTDTKHNISLYFLKGYIGNMNLISQRKRVETKIGLACMVLCVATSVVNFSSNIWSAKYYGTVQEFEFREK